jgi:CubicO group peptidase (beta-lactamase class C family)
MLGEIVARISETRYPQYVAEHILAPLGMVSTGFEPLAPELAGRCAVGYAGRAFSDELAIAPSMPLLWAEGGLWSTVSDLARWLSFPLAAHPGVTADDAQAESPVLAAATRREMHKPRYLSDEEWSNAWGISWYSARKDDVTWVQHSGGLPGFESNVCFDRGSRLGAIALVNGGADAAELASFLVAPGFRQSGEPVVFQRRADGTVTSMLHGGGCLVRLDPVS